MAYEENGCAVILREDGGLIRYKLRCPNCGAVTPDGGNYNQCGSAPVMTSATCLKCGKFVNLNFRRS